MINRIARVRRRAGIADITPSAMTPMGRGHRRAGITLTEILIAIMILGVGLVSLATLFPIGLLRLRDAARFSRTKYLVDSASGDGTARGLFSAASFQQADALNAFYGLTPSWYTTPTGDAYNPLIQDTPGYGLEWRTTPGTPSPALGANSGNSGGYGLPFAYDPLWRYQVNFPTGYYLDPIGQTTFEARFGSGIGFIRNDPSDAGTPSAYGLQRITNFNRPFLAQTVGAVTTLTPIMPISTVVPNIFVSPEDTVWVENVGSNQFSPVLPDLNLSAVAAGTPSNDWRYSWMFTGYEVSSSGGSTFEGNIVVFENRPFGITAVANPPNTAAGATYQVDGETVVEAIFGHSGRINPSGYGVGADRTVLLRWYASQPDPVVRAGDWIADVTYERTAAVVLTRFAGVADPLNGLEFDNLPAQRCIWYQVQKVLPPINDPYVANVPPLRSMVVTVDRTLESKTLLSAVGTPVVINAALIAPNVINVIPQQFTVRTGP
jgi:hypothetical protein